MKLLHFTDIHLTTPGRTIAGRDPNEHFERALAHAFERHADADLLAITGDLSDWGDREDYERLRARLAELPVPARVCIGNHDEREVFLEVFEDGADENGFAQGVAEIAGHRCLFLDTYEPRTHAGAYCEQRRAWLDARLAEHDGPHLIFMHHNPIPSGLAPMDQIQLQDSGAFRAVVARHAAKIRHIFFGHCHLPMNGSVAGVPASSLRGTCHQGFPVFEEKTLLTSADLPAAYGVMTLGPDYATMQMVEFGYDGPIRIEGSPNWEEWDRETMER